MSKLALSCMFRRFRREDDGMVSVEAAMMVPLLVFFLGLLYTTFDVFRWDATNAKAAYTLGDLVSRQTDPVNQDFIDGMKDIFDYISLGDPAKTWIRVSVVRYDGDDDENKLVWSHGSTGIPSLTQANINSMDDHIPPMSEEDTVILVETHMPYTPTMPIGWSVFNYDNFVVTRPRFASQVIWTNGNNT